ncbi:unnamed protein product [Rhizoctonia solani]|uniref:Uncharacterized protein n=1 Tax=Rhizoctonia solani TaxID=456999 RepID=A0A8H2WKS6_9AGAM|nr:unnamed protein product [Rhizoctonia solani]
MQLLGHYVSSGIFLELEDENYVRLDCLFGWIQVQGYPKQSPLAMVREIELLSKVLWEDWKTFFKALKSTYYPGISAIIFALWRVSRQESPTSTFQYAVVNEISFRYNLLSTSDQQHGMTYINIDILDSKSLSVWDEITQQVDLEDCRQVINAYIERFEPRHPVLYTSIPVMHGPIFLRPVARFVAPGTGDLLPKVLEVTVKRIWDQMKDPAKPHKPDLYVDAIRDTFANYTAVLRNSVFGQTNHALFQKLVDIVIRYDLIDLAAHAVLMLELPSEPPAPELVRTIYLALNNFMAN